MVKLFYIIKVIIFQFLFTFIVIHVQKILFFVKNKIVFPFWLLTSFFDAKLEDGFPNVLARLRHDVRGVKLSRAADSRRPIIFFIWNKSSLNMKWYRNNAILENEQFSTTQFRLIAGWPNQLAGGILDPDRAFVQRGLLA